MLVSIFYINCNMGIINIIRIIYYNNSMEEENQLHLKKDIQIK